MTILDRQSTRFQTILLLIIFTMLIAACGSSAQPAATETVPPTSAPTSPPVVEIELEIELPEGDAEVGFTRAIKYRCFACHVQELNGPQFDTAQDLPNIMERGNIRTADPAYEGSATTNQEYIIESILFTEIYLIPGEWEKAMPTYLGDIMTEQDLADVIAWMGTFE